MKYLSDLLSGNRKRFLYGEDTQKALQGAVEATIGTVLPIRSFRVRGQMCFIQGDAAIKQEIFMRSKDILDLLRSKYDIVSIQELR